MRSINCPYCGSLEIRTKKMQKFLCTECLKWFKRKDVKDLDAEIEPDIDRVLVLKGEEPYAEAEVNIKRKTQVQLKKMNS